MKLRIAGCFQLFFAGRALPQAVIPNVDCVDLIALDDSIRTRGTLFSHFGYFNPTANTVTIPAGGNTNFFMPGIPNVGQPSSFAPGRAKYIASIVGDASRDMIWIVGSQLALARIDPKIVCSALPTTPFLVPANLKLTAGTTSYGVELMKLAWVSPVSTAFSVSALLREAQPSLNAAGFVVASRDITLSNLRLSEAAVLGDVTVVPSPARLNYAMTISLASGGEVVGLKTASVEVYSSCSMTVTPGALPGGVVNTNYSPVTLMGSGATAPYLFEVVSGKLPAGMQFVNGVLSGTPTEAGTFAFSVNAISADRCLSRQAYTLTVGGPACAGDITGKVSLTVGGFRQNLVTGRWQQTVTLTNTSGAAIQGPVMVALQSLSANASLFNANGVTQCAVPGGRPYVRFNLGAAPSLLAGQTVTATLDFVNSTSSQAITYSPRVLAGGLGQ